MKAPSVSVLYPDTLDASLEQDKQPPTPYEDTVAYNTKTRYILELVSH